MSLFQMSIAGGTSILFIAVVRTLTIYRLPKATFLLLWVIAALRLLLPLSILLPFHIHVDIGRLPDTFQGLSVGDTDLPGPSPIVSSSDANIAIPSQAAGHVSIFTILWLSGVVLFAIWFSISYLWHIQKFRMSIPDRMPYVQDWLSAHRISRPIAVRDSDLISSPLTYGILRPVILLPKTLDRSNENTLKYVLTHEYVHIRRLDNITKIFFAAVLCIHWFNPLVWMMYVLVNRDMELSCDEYVIHIIGEKERAAYALSLISIEEKKSAITPFCSNFGKDPIEERIRAIMRSKRSSALMVVLALLLVVGTASAFVRSSDTAAGSEQNDPVPTTQRAEVDTAELAEAEGPYKTAESWAEALKTRDGQARYELMASGSKTAYYDHLVALNHGEDHYPWTIGVSSPYVVSYEIQIDGTAAVITYHTETSEPEEYIYQEELLFQEEGGKAVVSEYKVTVAYLRKDLYEEALEIQQQVREGHQTWRMDPGSVALEFVHRNLGIEDMGVISSSGDDIVFQKEGGQEIKVKIYRPIDTDAGFFAVCEYSIGDDQYILHEPLLST